METTIYLGIVRHILTLVGGVLVSKGVLTAGLLDTIMGAILAIAPIIWSTIEKIGKKDELKNAAANAARTGSPVVDLSPAKSVPAGQPGWVPPQN